MDNKILNNFSRELLVHFEEESSTKSVIRDVFKNEKWITESIKCETVDSLFNLFKVVANEILQDEDKTNPIIALFSSSFFKDDVFIQTFKENVFYTQQDVISCLGRHLNYIQIGDYYFDATSLWDNSKLINEYGWAISKPVISIKDNQMTLDFPPNTESEFGGYEIECVDINGNLHNIVIEENDTQTRIFIDGARRGIVNYPPRELFRLIEKPNKDQYLQHYGFVETINLLKEWMNNNSNYKLIITTKNDMILTKDESLLPSTFIRHQEVSDIYVRLVEGLEGLHKIYVL